MILQQEKTHFAPICKVFKALKLFPKNFWTLGVLLSVLACSDYREFDGADGIGDLTDCEVEALVAFEANISPAIESTCSQSGCHTSSHQALPFSLSDQASNRLALLRFSSGSVGVLTKKIYLAAPGHGGGNQSSNLPQTNIDAWLTEEAKCN